MPPPPDSGLPVEACLPALRAALAGPGHAVLQAPPGAGKTTVVPLRLMDEPWLAGGRIVVLEPRRLATRAAARRMAATLGEDVGATAGYRTRDERRTGPRTRVEVVTEGILTRRLQRDPELPGVGLLVFDEFHERNLHADLGLALAVDARRLLRPDLRLLVMSATLDGARIAALLGGDGEPAPVVTSEARAHPVDVRWSPKAPRDRLAPAVAAAVTRALRDDDGDALVFLPGAADIHRVEAELGEPVVGGRPVDVRPLYGALPARDQDAALEPSPPGRRRVVLATDIAETSLTVAGVRLVVDAGLARVPRHDARTGMTRLQTVPASRASADQRAGRAGRTEPGVAYRLWSKIEHAARRPFTDPEITQVDLAGFALELALWGDGAAERLALLDRPPAAALAEAHRLLASLGALDAAGSVTAQGRAMAALPVHPRLARMVTGALDEGHGWLACLVAALLEERDVLRGRPDDVPVELALRVALLADPDRRHPLADGRALRRTREVAADLARRVGAEPGTVHPDAAGPVLALAYPDRVAQSRGGPGRFRLRNGSGAWLPAADPLAAEGFLVAADLDGNRKEARIRLAAALDAADVDARFAGEVEERASLVWDRERDDLVARVERRLGQVQLAGTERRPEPGTATTRALLDRAKTTRLAVLHWTDRARALQQRIVFLRRHLGGDWPDVEDRALVRTLDRWLEPFLAGATGRAGLEAVDVAAALGALLTPAQRRDLDALAPPSIPLRGGRPVALDYSQDPPVLAVKVQELFGVREGPVVAGGRVPVVLHLLSPAGRPVQVTTDLAGFWDGSWHEVRKEMAGRYPKHAWPADPSAPAAG